GGRPVRPSTYLRILTYRTAERDLPKFYRCRNEWGCHRWNESLTHCTNKRSCVGIPTFRVSERQACERNAINARQCQANHSAFLRGVLGCVTALPSAQPGETFQ